MRCSVLLSVTLIFGACASTPKTNEIEVRPVTNETQSIDFEAAQIEAQNLYGAGDFIGAYEGYQSLLLQLPKDHSGRNQTLLAYADSALALGGDVYRSHARQAYTGLAKIDDLPQSLASRALAGQVLLGLVNAEHDEAIAGLEQALEQSPKDPRLWNALGRVYDEAAAWMDALDAYVKALQFANDAQSSLSPIVNNMGMSLLMQGRTEEALVKFERAREDSPDVQMYDNNWRLALTLSDRMDRALDGVDDKRAAQLFNDAGYISARNGQTNRARAYYKKAIALSPVYFERAEQNLVNLAAQEAL